MPFQILFFRLKKGIDCRDSAQHINEYVLVVVREVLAEIVGAVARVSVGTIAGNLLANRILNLRRAD
jgi:hypothetical protein